MEDGRQSEPGRNARLEPRHEYGMNCCSCDELRDRCGEEMHRISAQSHVRTIAPATFNSDTLISGRLVLAQPPWHTKKVATLW